MADEQLAIESTTVAAVQKGEVDENGKFVTYLIQLKDIFLRFPCGVLVFSNSLIENPISYVTPP